MSSATALLADAETAIRAGDWDTALEQLENLKVDQPGQPEVYDKLAHVLAVRGRFQSVITTYLEMIQVLVEAEQFERADGVVSKVLGLRPESSEAREHRIDIENKRGNVARAVYLSRELARLCIDQGDGERSIRLLQDALKHEPGNLDIALELAEMFVSHGHIQDGANQYRKVANAFQESGNISKAAEAYRRMKVVQSDDPDVLLTLGRLYTELGKLDEAEQEFRSVLRHDLDHEQALMQLGLVCQLKGRFRSGILAFNKVLQNNPTLVAAKRKLGELHHSQGMMTEAVEFFLQAAQGHLEAEEREEAIECFQIVLSVDENSAPAQQGLTNLGAAVKAKTFEPPTPPSPPEELDVPEPPPPAPVPFASSAPPEPVGGSGSGEFAGASPPNAGAGEPPKPEAAPKRPRTAGLAGGAAGGKRLGLGPRMGLTAPGGDKPMLGGDRPTLGGRPGLVRPGLGQKTMGGMMGAGGDKPMLSASPDRRPQLGAHRGEARPEAPPTTPREENFPEQPSFDDFSADLAPFETETTAASEPAGVAFDDDFSLPDSPFLEDAQEEVEPLSFAVQQAEAELFDDDFPSSEGPKIGSFSFGSDEEAEGDSGLRPSYAQEASLDFGEEVADELFNFDPEPGAPSASVAPVLGGGAGLFDGDESGDDLFGEQAGGGDLFGDEKEDNLFGEGQASALVEFDDEADLFGGTSPSSEAPSAFDTENDPFGNLFDAPDQEESVSDTLGGSKAAPVSFFSDDESSAASPVTESAFDNLFDGASEDVEPHPPSGHDDLFGSGDLFSGVEEVASPPDAGLFSGDSDSHDLFGDDDLFGGPVQAESGFETGFAPADGDSEPPSLSHDLFSDAQTDEGSLFESGSALEAPPAVPADGEMSVLFDGDAGDDFFGTPPAGELFDGAEPDQGLFGEEPGEEDLFGGHSTATDLFGEPAATSLGEDDFTQEPALGGLFDDAGGDSAQGEDLFSGLATDGDTLFDGFESGASTDSQSGFHQPAEPTEAAVLSEDSDLFGHTGNGLFDEVESPLSEGVDNPDFIDSSGDLFGEIPAVDSGSFEAEDAGDEPLFGQDDQGQELFAAEPDDDGSMFNIPLGLEAAEEQDSSPEEGPEELSTEDFSGGNEGGLFEEQTESDGLFASSDVEEPLPLDLELPMPGDAPLFGANSSEPEVSQEPDQDGGDDLFAPFDEGDPPLDFEIPQPMEDAASDGEGTSFSSLEEEPPDLMDIFDSTMPEVEEEPPLEIELPEPESLSFPEPSLEAGGDSVFADIAVDQELFEPSLELPFSGEESISVQEEPVQAEPDPMDLLSAEEKEELAQVAQADALDEQHAQSDAASKIAAYRKALDENPENLVLRTRLADIHLRYGLLEDAVVQYRQVMRRNPDSIPLLHRVIQAEFWNENYVEAGDSLLALAKLHLKNGEQHEALDTLQSVLSLDPLHFEARKELVSVFTALDDSKLAAHHLRQLAETALTKGEVDGAISAFQQLLELSEDPTLEERLAQIYEGQGDVVRALASFQNLVGRYRAEERWEEAARVTERIVDLDSNLLDERESLISLYQHLGHQQRAVEQQFQLARLYQERAENERAIGLYEEVLKVQTDNHDARRHLVDAYLDGGRVSAALEQAEALTEHYLDTKDHATAIYLYSRLVDADPENVDLQERLVKFYGLAGDPENAKSRWIHISHLHERGHRFDRAADAVQKALELDEGQLELYYRLALLHSEKLGDNQAALAQLRKLFQMAPDRIDAVKMYIDLLLKEEQVSEAGQVLQRLEQAGGESIELKANVISSLKASVEANPADLKARFNYGELCYHLGDLDHAIEQFQQTRRHHDFELLSYNMLGLCFASKRGYMMLDLAIKQFQKGLEVKGRPEQDYLEIRYNLAMVLYQNGRAKDALSELKECYNVDIAYRDVRSWIHKIEGELASGS